MQIATSALAVFGILQVTQFAMLGFDLSTFQYFATFPVEVSFWALKNLILPVAFLLAAAAAFLPKFLISQKQLPLVTAILAGTFLAQEIYVAAWQSSRGYSFIDSLLGYYQEININSIANFARPLVVAALVFAIIELRKQAALSGRKKTKGGASGLKNFLATLLDSSLENFISRKVSGFLYIITAWALIAAAAFLELVSLAQLLQGELIYLLVLLATPLALVLVLVLVRMAFEAGIALIVIAENTKK